MPCSCMWMNKTGSIPDIYYLYSLIVIDNHLAIYVRNDLAARVAVYFFLSAQFTFCNLFVYSGNKRRKICATHRPNSEIFSASSSDSGSQGSWWSLSSHVRYWQYRHVPSSPTRSRVWQARQGVPPTSSTSTPAKVYLVYPNNGNIDHNYNVHNSATPTSTSRDIISALSPVRDFGLCSSQTVRDAPAIRVTTDPTAEGC